METFLDTLVGHFH